MRHIDLLIAAPSDPEGLVWWGDYHFARELQLALHRLGVGSRLLFRDTYMEEPQPAQQSALLVLRGKFAPDRRWLQAARHSRKVAWIISWPLSPGAEELGGYDQLLVASAQDRPRLAAIAGRPAHTLLQASGFGSRALPRQPRTGLLFVGNYLGSERPVVNDFLRTGLPLELIGRGWQELGMEPSAAGLANEALPRRYGAALAVLNDHHRPMARYGYLNNRVFDVLACGVPVITDVAPGCPAELEPAVIRHQEGDDPHRTLERAQALRRDVALMGQVAEAVRERHSFEARAKTLLRILDRDCMAIADAS